MRYNQSMRTNMRLFIAIEFPEEIKAELEKSAALLRRACKQGTFTRRENFHLTLAFLGQVPSQRVNEITGIMDACASPSIPITIGHMGRFKHREGDVLWRQIEADSGLFQLQSDLAAALRAQGFPLEEREYKPHLTLARRAVLKDGMKLFELSAQMPDLNYTAEHMTLMRSEPIGGQIRYTPLHRTSLSVL